MKRVLLAVAAGLLASVAQAQTPAPMASAWSFGVFGGATFPVSDFSKSAGTGWHAGGLANYTDPSWPVGFRVDATYHGFGSKSFYDAGDTFEFKPRIFDATANVVWMFPMDQGASFRPYAIGGVGYYNLGFSCSGDCGTTASENKFGVNVGAGVEFSVANVGAFAEARFHNIFTDNSSTRMIPVSVGIVFRP